MMDRGVYRRYQYCFIMLICFFYILDFIVLCKSINNLVSTLSSNVSFLYIPLSAFLDLEDGGIKFLRSFGTHLRHSGCHKPECHKNFHRYAYLNSSASVHAACIHSLSRLTTVPQPLPKGVLHTGRSGAFSFSFQYSLFSLTLRLLMSYIYGAPSKVRNANVVYIWTYVWQR